MLVRLYDLPDATPQRDALAQKGILIRRANPYERHIVADWVEREFSPKWVSETKVAFARQPVSCLIATKDKAILGFACYDVTARGFAGPMGVSSASRESGIGKTLLLAALGELAGQGYAYAVIGGVGPREFYEKTVGAMPIEGSTPGIYRDLLPDP